MKTNKVTRKQIGTVGDTIAYLEDLINCFKANKIVVEHGDNHVVLTMPEQVVFEIGAKCKKGKSRFSLKLFWQEIPKDIEPFKISCQEPPERTPLPVDTKEMN